MEELDANEVQCTPLGVAEGFLDSRAHVGAAHNVTFEVPLLDDLRRAPEFRGHTGRPTKTTRRSEFRRRRAEEELS